MTVEPGFDGRGAVVVEQLVVVEDGLDETDAQLVGDQAVDLAVGDRSGLDAVFGLEDAQLIRVSRVCLSLQPWRWAASTACRSSRIARPVLGGSP